MTTNSPINSPKALTALMLQISHRKIEYTSYNISNNRNSHANIMYRVITHNETKANQQYKAILSFGSSYDCVTVNLASSQTLHSSGLSARKYSVIIHHV